MRAANINTNLVDRYYALLENLSPDQKLDLIALLSKSMKKTTKRAKDSSWKKLYGAFVMDQSVDEFVAQLKEDRMFRDKSIEL